MSDFAEFKNVIVTDRKQILGYIATDLKNLKSFEEVKKYASSLETKSNKYVTSSIPPMPEKRRRKEPKFRKISAYLAFCAHFRDSQRDKGGKLTKNVLDVTREAGTVWRGMDKTARAPWVSKAEQLTKVAKAEWDIKEAERAAKLKSEKTLTEQKIPTRDEIMSMKKKDLVKFLTNPVSSKDTLKDIRNLVVNTLYTDATSIPTTEEINKMKKNELVFMAERLGLELKDTKIKGIQAAIIQHYHN